MSNQVEVTITEAQSTSVSIDPGQEVGITFSPSTETSVDIEASSTPTVVEVNSPLLQQPVAAIRVDAGTSGVIYVGSASYGTAESAAVWTITRSTYSAAGLRTSKLTAVAVTWTGRASHTYS